MRINVHKLIKHFQFITSIGLPIHPSGQEQTAVFFSTLHFELAPQGVGLQKSVDPSAP